MNRIIVLLIVIVLLFTSCNNTINYDNSNSVNYIAKIAFEQKDDGWIYYFNIEKSKIDPESDNFYEFNGVNLKHKILPGYGISVIDEETSKVIDVIIPNVMVLVNGEDTQKDILTIGDYFNQHQFNAEIEYSDLESLNTINIDKNDVLELFNKTITKTEIPFGKYYNYPMSMLLQEELFVKLWWH